MTNQLNELRDNYYRARHTLIWLQIALAKKWRDENFLSPVLDEQRLNEIDRLERKVAACLNRVEGAIAALDNLETDRNHDINWSAWVQWQDAKTAAGLGDWRATA